MKLNEGRDLLDFNPTLVDLKLLPAALEGFTPCVDEVEQAQVAPCCQLLASCSLVHASCIAPRQLPRSMRGRVCMHHAQLQAGWQV